MKLRDIAIGANASMYYRLDFKKIRGVYYPRTEKEVLDAIAFAREHNYDVTPKGGGSGLSGACTGGNRDRIMLSSLQMAEILTISKDQGYVDVQPGATPDEINALLEPIGMKFYVAPSSRDIATVGGILSTDGGGNDTWESGTMRDNTLRVRMLTYDGRQLIVDWKGVKSDDHELEAKLNKRGMTIHDVASSHGTLGFITELRVAIKPMGTESVAAGLAEFEDYDALGNAIDQMIKRESPIRYSEAIVMAHPDVREDLNPPLLILEFLKNYEAELMEFVDFRTLEADELERMKDVRIKLPKRNPKEGNQVALFEGYGFHGDSLRNLQRSLDEIDSLLISHDLVPFAKYGHAPSKWYLGNNDPAYGLIMHSREIRPEGKSGEQLFETVLEIVGKCEELGVTPKPEHKWPFSDKAKNSRMEELREAIGEGFNTFILDDDCDNVLSSMV
ncbi:MAG: FAD-binding oxidoreductase [Promethearchaeota archaeon]